MRWSTLYKGVMRGSVPSRCVVGVVMVMLVMVIVVMEC